MTAIEFMKNLEGYYGRYEKPLVKAEVYKEIRGMNEKFLQCLYDELKLSFGIQYGKQPDVKVIETAREKVLEYYQPPAIMQTPQIEDRRDYTDEVEAEFEKLRERFDWVKRPKVKA